MAITIFGKYGGRATNPTPEYPGGTFKNKTSGQNDGTPLEHEWARDKDGFFQALLVKAGIKALETSDTAIFSQYLLALQHQFAATTKSPALDMAAVCEGRSYGAHDWSRPDAFPNFATTPSTVFRDACVAIDFETSRPCLYVVTDDDEVRKVTGPWDYDVSPVIGSAIPVTYYDPVRLTLNPPESTRSVCSDGRYLYILWRSATFTLTSSYHVTCLDAANGYAFVWGKRLELDASYAASGSEEYAKVIIANNNYLAVSTDNADNGNPGCGVCIVPRTSGSVKIGMGSGGPAGVSIPAGGRLTSDGDHVFWINRDTGANEAFICSASIDDPTTSAYSYHSIVQNSDLRSLPIALHNYGGSSNGTVILAPAAPSVEFIYMLVKANDSVQPVTKLTQLPASDTMDYTACMGFDGMNFWLRTNLVDQLSLSNCLAFCKIPATQFTDVLTYPFEHVVPTVVASIDTDKTVDYEPGRMLFDGKDMWYVARNGFVSRITNPGMR